MGDKREPRPTFNSENQASGLPHQAQRATSPANWGCVQQLGRHDDKEVVVT
jgi:hypothetical protein